MYEYVFSTFDPTSEKKNISIRLIPLLNVYCIFHITRVHKIGYGTEKIKSFQFCTNENSEWLVMLQKTNFPSLLSQC